MTSEWRGIWRGLALRVERDDERPGRTCCLHIGSSESASERASEKNLEWLHFDCSEGNPHIRFSPDESTRPLDERGDPIAECFDRLRAEPARLLEQAGLSREALDSMGFGSEGLSTADGAGSGDVDDRAERDESVLREAERAMRHRPAVLDGLDLSVLRHRRSEKWHTYPADVLPAWVAEMDFPVAAPIQDELRRFAESGDVGYPIGLRQTGLPEVFADRMREAFGWRPDPARAEILSEVVQGMYIALEAFSEPGDGVVVQTPIYPPFLSSVKDTGRRLVENRMRLTQARMEFDLDGLATSIDANTRLLLFCNPHNPSGRVYSRSELERVASLAIEHDLIVVSDEIHGDLVFDAGRHIPLASLGPEIADRTLTLTSASKAFNIPGLRTAIAHFGNRSMQKRFNTVQHRHTRGGIGLFGLYATMAAWRWGQPWLDELVPYLAENRPFLGDALAERLPEIGYIEPEATYLAWLDCRGLDLSASQASPSEETASPAALFLAQGRVALSDGRLFGPGWEGFVRLNFGTSRAILAEVVERMAKSVGR